MGDAWGGDVSAYRREGEVELGPTTWLYFDSGCAPQRFGTRRGTAISVSAQDMVSQFGSETCGPLCVDSTDPFAIFQSRTALSALTPPPALRPALRLRRLPEAPGLV